MLSDNIYITAQATKTFTVQTSKKYINAKTDPITMTQAIHKRSIAHNNDTPSNASSSRIPNALH
jgi:hypothetical protein